MKKTLIAIISLAVVALGATFAFAHSGSFGGKYSQNSQSRNFHEEMEEVIKNV